MDEQQKRIDILIRKNVLADITLAIYKELTPSGCLTIEELLKIINSLKEKYENGNG